MAGKSDHFAAVPTSQDDVCLIAFTSGTTGEPKATMHFHRDVLAMCETFARHMVPADETAIFSGTPSIAFTFGLGGLLVFPLYFRAAIALPKSFNPRGPGANRLPAIGSRIFSPRRPVTEAMSARKSAFDLSSLQRLRLGGGSAFHGDFRSVVRGHRHSADRRHRRHRDDSYFHLRYRRRYPPRRHGQAGARLSCGIVRCAD